MLPLAFNLRDARVLVIGAGAVGARKAAQLIEYGARVSVIAEQVRAPLPAGVVRVEQRPYRRGDLAGFSLVVAATGDPSLNDDVFEEARERNLWLNVVDDPQRSSFYFMALHRQGEVSVAVTTSGASPALAREVRDRVAAALPSNLAAAAATLRAERASRHARGESTEGVDWRPLLDSVLAESAGT